MLHHKDHFCSAFLPGGTLVWALCNFLSRHFSTSHKNLSSLVSWSTFQSSTCPHVYLLNCNYPVRGFGTELMGRREYSEWCTCHKSPFGRAEASATANFCASALQSGGRAPLTIVTTPNIPPLALQRKANHSCTSYCGACSSLHYIPTKRGKICEKSKPPPERARPHSFAQ